VRPFVVHPGPPLRGELRPPGDKSITHRAYVLGLLAEGETVIHHPNAGEDCEATLRCVQALGAEVEAGPGVVRLVGTGGGLRAPDRILDCGNSGTTLRLLAGVLASQPFEATLSGDESLRRRPVDRVIAPLRAMGATLSASGDDRLPPLVVQGGPLKPCPEEFFLSRPTPSAQVASAVLIAGLHATGRTTVHIAAGVRDHTVHLLREFGVPVEYANPGTGAESGSIAVTGPARLRGCDVQVPGDFSAAAFFLAAAAISPGARIRCTAVNLNPTRTGFQRALAVMGSHVDLTVTDGLRSGEALGTITVTGPAALQPMDIEPASVPGLVDEIPVWAALASVARGVSRLRGAGEVRLKESDRLSVLAEGLRALGVRVEEFPDGLDIHGGPVAGGTVRSHGDHRVAMAFAVLGTRAAGPVTVDDVSCISTSYPGFVDDLRSLGGVLEELQAAGGAR
jgi:3-phosphoshikimate 1-carboxyvinyltransferase